MPFYEHHKRSIVKSVTFRALVLISDFVVIYFFTHRVDLTVGLIIITNLASTLLYYGHERVWNTIRWGKQSR